MPSFKIDENLPIEFAQMLRVRGHDALTVNDQRMSGLPDPRLADVCLKEGRTMVTLDLDFADIRSYSPRRYSGIIVLRPGVQNKRHLIHLFRPVVDMLDREPLSGWLWIVDETGVRLRGDEPA